MCLHVPQDGGTVAIPSLEKVQRNRQKENQEHDPGEPMGARVEPPC